MPSDYEKAHANYRALVKAAAAGDKQAFADKAKAMSEIRQIEREAARAGTILSATYGPGDKVNVKTAKTTPKDELHGDYIRKFDKDKAVMLPDRPGEPPRETNLQEYHSRRLRGR